mgnify:CR=1 FL=1
MSWQLPQVMLTLRPFGMAGCWKPPATSGRGAEAFIVSTTTGAKSSSFSGIGKRPGDQVDHLPFMASPEKTLHKRTPRL